MSVFDPIPFFGPFKSIRRSEGDLGESETSLAQERRSPSSACFFGALLLAALVLTIYPTRSSAYGPAAGAEATPETPGSVSPASTGSESPGAVSAESGVGQVAPAVTAVTAVVPVDSYFATTTVTATGTKEDSFEVPTAVTVVDTEELRKLSPNNAADLLVYQPGVDVNGVGANQTRPIIRGQRGLRVLFLQDGLSLNNPRRQSDFGEITGVLDVEQVDAVEVVRGPSSVLYGSGAIGGVLNLVTRPAFSFDSGLALGFGARLSSADDQKKVTGSLDWQADKFSLAVAYSDRDAKAYEAPSGTFGKVRLDRDTKVFDTGVKDRFLSALIGVRLTDHQFLSLRSNRYDAGEFGFGFVDPQLLDPQFDGTQIRIFYPFQKFDRDTLRWSGSGLMGGPANTIDVKVYRQSNERELAFDAAINIGPVFRGAQDSSLKIDTLNFTDLDTWGLRAEATRAFGSDHLLTYGAEHTNDDLLNTDSSRQALTFRFPFPPSVIGLIPGFTCVDFVPPFECTFEDLSDRPNAPNAENISSGVFVQDDWQATDRFGLIAGLRYQKVQTKATATPGFDTSGLDFDDDAVVGAINGLFRATDKLHVVASVGTSFRAPSIVERLFNGLTPEGLGYQLLNADLTSEKSENYELGLKFRSRNAFAEAFVFRNEITDGIIQHFLTPQEVSVLPTDLQSLITRSGVDFVVQQRNIDDTRVDGFEFSGGYRFGTGVSLGGNLMLLDSARADSKLRPTGNVAEEKVNVFVRYEPRGGRYSLEYRWRHNGEENAVIEVGDPIPLVGDRLPSFDVHSVIATVRLFDSQRFSHSLGLVVDNLTDELYAEFSNVGSFRPQPKRNFVATYRLRIH